MLREVLVASVIVAVLAVLVFVPRWLRSPEPAAQMPTCDVLAGPCRWHSDQGEGVVEAEPLGEGDQGTEFRLQVRAPVAPERFLAVLRGESMYMGEYPVPLMPDDKGGWNARFTAPFCTTGSEMQWRIDLQSGQRPVGAPPARLTFWAR